MRTGTKAFLAQEGGKLASDILRIVLSRPHKPSPLLEHIDTTQVATVHTTPSYSITPTIATATPEHIGVPEGELDYRFECVMKHLGGASVLLREAFERANDEGIGEGTAEKIMEAMNEHSGMEADLEKMLAMPEARDAAEKLLSGVRAFRKAAWEANLPRGGGTKEDVGDARLWNDILYQEAFANAKAHPGEECVAEGL